MGNFLIRFLIVLLGAYSGAYGEELPSYFRLLKPIDLPISRRSSYPSKEFSLEKVSPGHEQVTPTTAAGLYKHLMSSKDSGLFSLNNDLWSGYKNANLKNTRSLRVAKLPCVSRLECFLVSPDSGTWIVVSDGRKITDFQLSNALKYIYSEEKGVNTQVGQLDTMFGEVGVFPYPETDYEKTGIFCSILTTALVGGQEKVQIFKRRITPEGKIENKAMPDGVQECNLPW